MAKKFQEKFKNNILKSSRAYIREANSEDLGSDSFSSLVDKTARENEA